MTLARVGLSGAVIAVVVAYAVGAGLWTSQGSDWYATLTHPAWQPPDVVFGVMWPLNFLAIGVAGLAVAARATPRAGAAWVVLLVVSVAAALGWARTFYVAHDLGLAAILLAAAAVLTWCLVLLTAGVLRWAAWVLVPYALWMSIATSLAVGYWSLARGGGSR